MVTKITAKIIVISSIHNGHVSRSVIGHVVAPRALYYVLIEFNEVIVNKLVG